MKVDEQTEEETEVRRRESKERWGSGREGDETRGNQEETRRINGLLYSAQL